MVAFFQDFAWKIDEQPFFGVHVLGDGVDAVGQDGERGFGVRGDMGLVAGTDGAVEQLVTEHLAIGQSVDGLAGYGVVEGSGGSVHEVSRRRQSVRNGKSIR